MSDNNLISLAGLTQMGAGNYSVTGDRTTGTIDSVEPVSTPPSSIGFSGDLEVPSTVPAMTADEATEEHTKLAAMMADIDSKLGAMRFDVHTGNPTGFQAEGRARELLQIQRQSLENALQYLGHRALEQLPKRAERSGAADDALVAQAQREQNISALASTLDSNGKEIGRVRAAALIDEAMMKDRAAALVRGGR